MGTVNYIRINIVIPIIPSRPINYNIKCKVSVKSVKFEWPLSVSIWNLNFFVLTPFVSTASHLKTLKRVKHKLCAPPVTLTKNLKTSKLFLFASKGSNVHVLLFYANLTMSRFSFFINKKRNWFAENA
jgi:hypothetical protein